MHRSKFSRGRYVRAAELGSDREARPINALAQFLYDCAKNCAGAALNTVWYSRSQWPNRRAHYHLTSCNAIKNLRRCVRARPPATDKEAQEMYVPDRLRQLSIDLIQRGVTVAILEGTFLVWWIQGFWSDLRTAFAGKKKGVLTPSVDQVNPGTVRR
jgi:hypothetical protein